ncbi:DUF2844 domain-containing protein [Caballeronia sp. LZ034LL]|uniref:DUF2844 domain-containing protein n=1 Tax=Caballeronia sp. LZ034LL TaxID=3038567 RepID=UPI00285C393A|nr:DUF2844 domain-containing protein [Caballeronia sp. LZ034LL]MDR5833640.1 DUF2844 domain-containing protein [Caballeronia sp. LZ034LL]
MTNIRHPKNIARGLAIGSLLLTATATAHLGGTVRASDEASDAVMRRAQSGLPAFSETTDANGIVIREYVDGNGAVYAVSWRGPAMPDIQALLGAHFETFRDGALASMGTLGLHTAQVATGDLVVENHMRLREFSGRAWLANALPPGMNASDIQ